MRQSNIVVVGIFAVIFGLFALINVGGGEREGPVIIPVYEVSQGDNPWCWAAATAVAYNHKHDLMLPVCEVASIGLGRDCCADRHSCAAGANIFAIYDLLESFRLHGRIVVHQPDFNEIIQAIDDGQVMLLLTIMINGNGLVGHVVTIHGYDKRNQNIYVWDSALGRARLKYDSKSLGIWGQYLAAIVVDG